MAKWLLKAREYARLLVQTGFTALTNGYARGFQEGNIYKGSTKAVCVPGLNCYSCPGALGACPIGSLQATLGSRNYKFAFYVTGFLMLVGAVLGRFVCGWLCPFGLVQDLIHKIPFPKKLRKLPGDKALKWLKYVMLALFVVLLPLFAVDAFGQGKPWFCAYVCPSGTLGAGVPLVAVNEGLRAAVGFLYTWKVAILVVLLLLSVVVYRPFCRYLCPLGAVYGLFNPIAFYRLRVDGHKCTRCGACRRACKLDIPANETPNSPECIRCGACVKACPTKAISAGFREKKACGRCARNEQ